MRVRGQVLGLAAVCAAAAACGLDAAHDAFCRAHPDVCAPDAGGTPDTGPAPDAGTPDAGPSDSGAADAGPPGCACTAPLITEPHQNQKVGPYINLQADGGTCIASMLGVIYGEPDAGNDARGTSGNSFPDGSWVPTSPPGLDAGTYSVVVYATDSSGNACRSQTVTFVVCRNYPTVCP